MRDAPALLRSSGVRPNASYAAAKQLHLCGWPKHYLTLTVTFVWTDVSLDQILKDFGQTSAGNNTRVTTDCVLCSLHDLICSNLFEK